MTAFNLSSGSDLSDFVASGGSAGVNPHPLFDNDYYLGQLAGAKMTCEAGVSLLQHYAEHGASLGLSPHPMFDAAFYIEQCEGDPEAAAAPLAHFLSKGWKQRLDPHPLFSTSYYLERHPDVAAAGINPLLHCLRTPQAAYGEISPWFDGAYYFRTNPDLVGSDMSPLKHYFWFGLAESRTGSQLAAHALASNPAYRRPYGLIDLALQPGSTLSWKRERWRLAAARRRQVHTEMAAFSYSPLVSLLLHVSDGTDLRGTLHSLVQQGYTRWQLCVVIDAGVDPGPALDEYAKSLPQIAVVRRGRSDNAAHALNTALDMAAGEFVGIIEAGARLHTLALHALVARLQGEDHCKLVYGDECAIDEHEIESDPLYKPDWSPEYLLAYNYPARLGLYRMDMVRALGGFRPTLSVDPVYDLTLRASRVMAVHDVRHVPKIIYYKHRAEVADRAQALHVDSLYRALACFLDEQGLRGRVTPGTLPQFHRTTLFNRTEPLISVVIPTANASFAGALGREWVLTNCLRGLIERTVYRHLEIIVVHDGNLTAEQIEYCSAHGVRLLPYTAPFFNFSEKINLGATSGSGEYLLLLNDDTEAKQSDWLNVMLGYAEQDGVGVVGAKLFFPDGRLQHTGIIMQNGVAGHLYYRADGDDPGLFEMNAVARNYVAVTGACQLVKRSIFDQVGGYDEHLPLNFNDVDFCLRVLDAGFRNVYAADAELFHFEGVTKEVLVGDRRTTLGETNQFQAAWRSRYMVDPFYHPQLPPYMPLGWELPGAVRRTARQARMPAGSALAAAQQGVNFLGPVNRSSGMGSAARGYVAALQDAGSAVRIVNLDKVYHHQSVVGHDRPSADRSFPISIVHVNAESTGAVLAHYPDEFYNAQYRIGLWVWELPAASEGTFESLKAYDEIWVPSRFSHDTFRPLTRAPITIVPHAVADLPDMAPGDEAAFRESIGVPSANFVFLYMFDVFSSVERKNPAALLDAFEAEFRDRGDVTLVLKISYFEAADVTADPASAGLLARLEQCLARCPNIILITTILPQPDLYRLINAADCYVSPHRSEGFGLAVAEAMYYGKTVISTDFSGTKDLVTPETGLPLKYQLVELAEDVGPYKRGNVWAEPSVTHLRELMQTAVADHALRDRLGAAARAHIARNFSSARIGKLARDRLLAIAGRL